MRILSLEKFIEAHQQRHERLKRYIASAWGRKSGVDAIVIEHLTARSAMSLFATNTAVRVAAARATTTTFHSLVTALARRKTDVLWITITPRRFALPRSTASVFDHAGAITWARSHLGTGNYLGVVEPAYYGNVSIGPSGEPTVSWHFHIPWWGKDDDVNLRMTALKNATEPSLLPGRDVLKIRKLTTGRMLGRALYMLKAPLSEYRMLGVRQEAVDTNTGEIFERRVSPTKKRPLRTGDLLRMCGVLGDRTVEELLFASAEGTEVLHRIMRRTRRLLRQERRSRLKLLQLEMGLRPK